MNKTELLYTCPNTGTTDACSKDSIYGCPHAGQHYPKTISVNPDGSDGTNCQLRCGNNGDPGNFKGCKLVETYGPDLTETDYGIGYELKGGKRCKLNHGYQ